ncbi:MAG TPA: MBL fold metallo-hydrolase [Ktedonobacterales bacterium]|nr:MBL fold metallo-hydrolase [Ktedonobacterales bacterium]
MTRKSRRQQRPHDGSDKPAPMYPSYLDAPDVRDISLPSSDSAVSRRLWARFWGVRGTRPMIPMDGSRFGGNTACLEVRYAGHVLIFDAGSGIVGLGDALLREWSTPPAFPRPTLTLLFTHAHHDHLCGLPFFAPLFQRDADIHLLGPDLAGLRFEEIISGYIRSPYFPVDFNDLPSQRRLYSIADGTRLLWREGASNPFVCDISRPAPADALVVDVMHSRLHPRNGTLVYRITAGGRSLVFATDVEIGDGANSDDITAAQRLIRFARGSDVLVHDAQYSDEDYGGAVSRRGFGHSTPAMAAHIARAAEVGKLVLFHHDPSYADADVSALERTARSLFPEVQAAREGQEICLDGL